MSYKKTKDEPYYPSDICGDCGKIYGTVHEFPVTYWEDICGWCDEEKSCTSPRDMGYPKYPKDTDYTTIECEEEEDGSLSFHIPDDLVQKIVQAFIENALYDIIRKENQVNT